MSRPVLTAAETRAAEDRLIAAGTGADQLMAWAGAGLARAALALAGPLPALVCCGPGNNGGDGYVAARWLRDAGLDVMVAALGAPSSGAAAAARAGWDGPVVPLDQAAPRPLLIDALFGTGLSRPLAAPLAATLARLMAGAQATAAADLPSGVETDSGALLGAELPFDMTVAMGALKPAHLLQPAAGLCGRLVVADIGLAAGDRTQELAAPRLSPPGAGDHKYSRGLVAVIGGAMPGAARLAAIAAARAGAGYVRLIADTPASLPNAIVQQGWDEAALADPRIAAIVAGPGLGRDGIARRRLDAACAAGRPLVIDGDALHLLPRTRPAPPLTVLTPHEGEFAARFGDLPGSKLDRARAAAMRAGAVIVFKGADTVIAAPDGRAAIAPPASAWLSTAGTGDVLAGVIGALLARGLAPFEAAGAGVWLHASAAARLGPAFIADDLAAAIGGVAGEAGR